MNKDFLLWNLYMYIKLNISILHSQLLTNSGDRTEIWYITNLQIYNRNFLVQIFSLKGYAKNIYQIWIQWRNKLILVAPYYKADPF